MLFQSRERLALAFNNVSLSFRTYGTRPIFETHASAFLNPADEGDVEVPIWTPNESGEADAEFASHCAFIALPEPQTLPPRTAYHVLLEVGAAGEFFRELEQIWRHDGDRVRVYYEIRVFLYGRRRERRV